MSVRAMNDSVFEALLRQAVIDRFNEELDSLPPDEELARVYIFSQMHESRMQRLFAIENRKEKLGNFVNWSKKIAAVLVIAVTIFFCALMFVPEVRATVTGTIIEWYEKFVRFTSNVPETEKTGYEPMYIPAGFIEIVRDEGDMTTTIIYSNEDGTIIVFLHGRESGSTAVDIENSEHDIILSKGIEYHLLIPVEDKMESTIVWTMEGQRYTITSVVSIDELLRIADSVGKK